MRHVLGLSVALSLLAVGCPGPLTPPADTSSPDGGRLDAPGMRDTPGLDVPGLDAPGADVPAAEDVPGLDTGMADAFVDPCGNGMIDTGEDCDMGDLGGADCASVGFDVGTLACASDCTFDTRSCRDFRCPDGVAEGTEECDMIDLRAQTCMGLGFDAGTLSCNGDCTLNTGACTRFSCGNGMIEGMEQCDGTNLGMASCMSRGFDGGTLACTTMGCMFDTAACTRCGNGRREGTEVCDMADVGTATCVSRGFLSGTLGCAVGCAAFDTTMCSAGAVPTAGQLVITEIMPDPNAVADTVGEWFEVQNTSAGPLELRNCVVSDNQAMPATFTVSSSVVVAAGAFATFARSASPGFTPTYVYPSAWALANADDEVRITCGGALIDSVLYSTPGAWGFAPGRSTQLTPAMTNATANDLAANWCAGTAVYQTVTMVTDRGTPGAANAACGAPTAENCTNMTDDDGDMLVDCADPDCATAPSCSASTARLIISEYVEGSSNNKAIEIRNLGTAPIDLAASACQLRVYTTVTGLTVNLTGTIVPGDVFVVCNMLAGGLLAPLCDQLSSSITYNGDDAVELRCGPTTLDVVGQIGVDPGTEWGTGLVSTADNTIRRRCPIMSGDPNGADAFDPSIQWSGYAVDTFGDLGLPGCDP